MNQSDRSAADSTTPGSLASANPLTVTMVYTIYLPFVVFQEVMEIGGDENNGGFESGPVLWDQFSTNGQQLILPASSLGVPPHSGEWAARLGHLDDEISMISQGVSIPAGLACLVFWQWVVSDDVCNADAGGVGINGVWVDVSSLCAGTSTAQWVQRRVNLSKFSTAVTTTLTVLNFAVSNDFSVPSTMYVDDVSFQQIEVCAVAPPSARDFAEPRDDQARVLIGQPITRSIDIRPQHK